MGLFFGHQQPERESRYLRSGTKWNLAQIRIISNTGELTEEDQVMEDDGSGIELVVDLAEDLEDTTDEEDG